MQIETDQLANFIFLENKTDKYINIEIDGIRDSRDMFMFCLELLYKGISMMYDTQQTGIDIDGLTEDQFKAIKQKLLLAGIDVNLHMEPIRSPVVITHPTKQHVVDEPIVLGSTQPQTYTLEHHHLVISTERAMYDISFALVHNTAAIDRMSRHRTQ